MRIEPIAPISNNLSNKKDKRKSSPTFMKDPKGDINSFEELLNSEIEKKPTFNKLASLDELIELSKKNPLVGGQGDNLDISDIPKEELMSGMKIESEHSKDPAIKIDIVKDHEDESPNRDYYTGPNGLENMEEKLKNEKEGMIMDTKFKGAKSLDDLFKTAYVGSLGNAPLQGPASTDVDANAVATGDTSTDTSVDTSVDTNIDNTNIDSVNKANEVDEDTKSKINSICSDEIGRLTTFLEKLGDFFPRTGISKEDIKIDKLLEILTPVQKSFRNIKNLLAAPTEPTNV